MRYLTFLLIIIFTIATFPVLTLARDEDDEMLQNTLMGGLLGAGVGAAVGSGEGHAGKGAAIGAGIGALGAVLIHILKNSSQRKNKYDEDDYYGKGQYPSQYPPQSPTYKYPKPAIQSHKNDDSMSTTHKKVIREYDEEGNVIAEKEIYLDN